MPIDVEAKGEDLALTRPKGQLSIKVMQLDVEASRNPTAQAQLHLTHKFGPRAKRNTNLGQREKKASVRPSLQKDSFKHDSYMGKTIA